MTHRRVSFTALICGIVLLSLTLLISAKNAKDLEIKVYEVDERNSVQRILENRPNSDVTLDRVNRIRLECNSPFPVQWIYSGNGVPALTSTIKKETEQRFSASAFITTLKEAHSGRYDCVSTGEPDISAYFFLYVPGLNIFTATDGSNDRKKIYIPKNDSRIVIPCSVSNPEIPVVLEKLVARDVLVAIKSFGGTPAYSYDPRIGFSLDTNRVQDPESTYACTAFGRGSKKTIEFDVTFGRRDDLNPSPFPSLIGSAPPSDATGRKCSTHHDCPPNWACYTDLVCRDPCLNSIRCGIGATCKYNDRSPYCECPRDFIGDPSKECFNTLQGSDHRENNTPRPSRPEPSTTRSPFGSQCKVDEHCSATHICLNGNCLDACAVKKCHRDAYCVTDERRMAKCVCNPGFVSQNGDECSPERILNRTNVEFDSSRPIPACRHNQDCPANTVCIADHSGSSSCKELCGTSICQDPAPLKCSASSHHCGPNTDCEIEAGKAVCHCKPNFVGKPPQCTQQCKFNIECPENHACLQNKCVFSRSDPRENTSPEPFTRSPAGSQCKVNEHCSGTKICLNGNCLDACSVKICHRNAYCVTDERRVAKCLCNPGFASQNGDDCTPERLQLELNQKNVEFDTSRPACRYNRDCPVNRVCKTSPSGSSYCGDICGPSICGEHAICSSALCTCKPNFVGDPATACYEKAITVIESTKGLGHCSADEHCGSHQKCETLSGDVRKCVDACVAHRCPFNLDCRAVGHRAECVCPKGFTGSSVIGCSKTVVAVDEFKRGRDLPLPGNLQIMKTSTPATTATCSTNDYQCGPNSECRIVAGNPTCFCQTNFVGKPPRCQRECMFNIECNENHACVQNKCICTRNCL